MKPNIGWGIIALEVLLTVAGFAEIPQNVPALSSGDAVSYRFHRPTPDKIHAETQKILDDPKFAPYKSLRQLFWEWLGQKFQNWKAPHIPDSLARILLIILISWCVLTLLAILAHAAWTIYVLLSNRSSAKRSRTSRTLPEHTMSLDELLELMRVLADKGDFRQAMSVLMIALLRWLDGIGAVRFHESKTNGDYLREFPRDRIGIDYFRRLVLAFDETVYGRKNPDRDMYVQMKNLFDRMRTDVTPQP